MIFQTFWAKTHKLDALRKRLYSLSNIHAVADH